MTTIAASMARNNFQDLLNRACCDRERILVERHGKAIATAIELEDLKPLEVLEAALDSVQLPAATSESFVSFELIAMQR
jgi:PHD/YefM family antitoxin component YafN of YafNO toxin-antitoxin module